MAARSVSQLRATRRRSVLVAQHAIAVTLLWVWVACRQDVGNFDEELSGDPGERRQGARTGSGSGGGRSCRRRTPCDT
jgi:hypothetical protein